MYENVEYIYMKINTHRHVGSEPAPPTLLYVRAAMMLAASVCMIYISRTIPRCERFSSLITSIETESGLLLFHFRVYIMLVVQYLVTTFT